MPGIIPMKVIKVGTSAQSRIAQACDRCRSKKIRCDGITPCCSQCANVGFECKTSDKLSRRAFPRGYTESLEERVRTLEGEVKELKDLLDEKDEKIDLISRVNSNSSPKQPSVPVSPAPSFESKPCALLKEDVFRMQQLPFLTENKKAGSYFMGTSSSRAFVDSVKRKIQESGKPCANFNVNAFFAMAEATPATGDTMPNNHLPASGVPPRLISDQLMNIFFQEWAPMYPVLHRPTFLKLYADYTADPNSISNPHAIAQLHLVFGIAAISSESNEEIVASSESHWRAALDSVMSENSLSTLQCLVLAQIYCICKADYDSLGRYKGVAVSLAYRLGLHQSQKRFSLGALTRETRKKVFWSLYTVDSFSATLLGLPTLLKDTDIHTEYPSDVDDENVTERGFQPTLPGESTRLSSALALFRLARIMSQVLTEIYSSASSQNLSLLQISALGDKLDAWRDELAPHLRLQFVQDKPSTNVVCSRSPLLSLAFYFIRTLIYRPAVLCSLGAKGSSSVVALADSSKHIIQIVQLLEERRMSFSMCLNKNEVLLLAGLSLILQGLDIKQEGKLMHDNQRLVLSVINILDRHASSGASTFKKVAYSTIVVEQIAKPPSPVDSPRTSRRDSTASSFGPQAISEFARQQLQAVTSHFSFSSTQLTEHEVPSTRRSTVPSLSLGSALHSRNLSQASVSSARSEPVYRQALQTARPQTADTYFDGPNLDYLSFYDDESPPTPSYTADVKAPTATPEWETLLGFIDADEAFPEDDEYPSSDPLPSYLNTPSQIDTFSQYLQRAQPTGSHGKSLEARAIIDGSTRQSASIQNDFSLSEESLTSGEDPSSCELGMEYRGILMPSFEAFEGLAE